MCVRMAFNVPSKWGTSDLPSQQKWAFAFCSHWPQSLGTDCFLLFSSSILSQYLIFASSLLKPVLFQM